MHLENISGHLNQKKTLTCALVKPYQVMQIELSNFKFYFKIRFTIPVCSFSSKRYLSFFADDNCKLSHNRVRAAFKAAVFAQTT